MLVSTTLHCGAFEDPLLPLGRSNSFFFNCYLSGCRRQQCEIISYLPSKRNNGFPLHWCQDTKYLVLLSAISAHIGFCVNCPSIFFSQILTKFWSSRQIFIEAPNKGFHTKVLLVEASLIDAYRQTDIRTDRHDKAKQISFAICVNARKIEDN